MTPAERIKANIQEIREYTRASEDLRERAHHFLYDKRLSDAIQVQFIVMGINPGEPPSESNKRGEFPLEETSESDYMKHGTETSASRRYQRNCERICGTRDIALTEALFWSSYNLDAMEQRYAADMPFRSNQHALWCVPRNKQLIEAHNPRAVVFIGLRYVPDIVCMYDLHIFEQTIRFAKATQKRRADRLIVRCYDKSGRPWVFLKHFAAHPSKHEKDVMREFVSKTVALPNPPYL